MYKPKIDNKLPKEINGIWVLVLFVSLLVLMVILGKLVM